MRLCLQERRPPPRPGHRPRDAGRCPLRRLLHVPDRVPLRHPPRSGQRPRGALRRLRDRATPACVEACPTGALSAGTPPDERVRSDFRGHVVVVGSSAAGIAACEAAREHAPGCSITLVTADASPYSRPLLSYALAGRLQPLTRPIGAARATWKTSWECMYSAGAGRCASSPALGALMLDNGAELAFDRLIVATGARAAGLSIPGADLAGVFVLRNFEDLEAISDWCCRHLATPWQGTRAVSSQRLAPVGMSADAGRRASHTPWCWAAATWACRRARRSWRGACA